MSCIVCHELTPLFHPAWLWQEPVTTETGLGLPFLSPDMSNYQADSSLSVCHTHTGHQSVHCVKCHLRSFGGRDTDVPLICLSTNMAAYNSLRKIIHADVKRYILRKWWIFVCVCFTSRLWLWDDIFSHAAFMRFSHYSMTGGIIHMHEVKEVLVGVWPWAETQMHMLLHLPPKATDQASSERTNRNGWKGGWRHCRNRKEKAVKKCPRAFEFASEPEHNQHSGL